MKISVVVPLYNKAPYIVKAVNSILAQSYLDFELIIVNDGSKDNSLSVVQELVRNAQRDNIHIIDQENTGVATARNNGVNAARGEYIAFLDADDWWSEEYLEQMAKLINKFPGAGIYGCGYYIVKNGRNRVAPIGVDSGFDSELINYCKVYAKTLCMPLWTGAVVIKKNIFQEFDGFKPHIKLGEDFDLWIRVALNYSVAFLNKPLAYYNQDVDLQNRAVGNLHKPKTHMLWNLDYLSERENNDPDYKSLIDKLRVNSLLRYYLVNEYREAALSELKKVDWSKQPKSIRDKYNSPIWWLKSKMKFMKLGSYIKQLILKRI